MALKDLQSNLAYFGTIPKSKLTGRHVQIQPDQNSSYGTYAPGGKRYTTQRNPERLIKRSVREVASGLLGQRFGVQVDR